MPYGCEENVKGMLRTSQHPLEAAIGFEPMNKGFADLCLTTWLWRRIQEKAYEPYTFSLYVMVPPGGIEPPTRGFSVPCSTD